MEVEKPIGRRSFNPVLSHKSTDVNRVDSELPFQVLIAFFREKNRIRKAVCQVTC